MTQLHESSDPSTAGSIPSGLVTLTIGLFSLILALIEGNSHGWTSRLIIGCSSSRAIAADRVHRAQAARRRR